MTRALLTAVSVLLAILPTLASADDSDHAGWREVPFHLSGDPHPEAIEKPIHRVGKRGAKVVRVLISELRLTAGESLEVYDAAHRLVQRIRRSGRGIWTREVDGERVYLLLRHPVDGEAGHFTVSRLAYRTTGGAAGPVVGPKAYKPVLTSVRLYRIGERGGRDRLPPKSLIRLAPQGLRPDTVVFAVVGIDQKGKRMGTREFGAKVTFEGSLAKGLLRPLEPGVWRFSAGPTERRGLVLDVRIPDAPSLSTTLRVDIIDPRRSPRPPAGVRAALRKADGTAAALPSGAAIHLVKGPGRVHHADIAVTATNRDGEALSPAVLSGLRFRVSPADALTIVGRSAGIYRLIPGPRAARRATLVLEIPQHAHEAYRLTVHIPRHARRGPRLGPVLRQAESQPEAGATATIEVPQAEQRRPRFELAGDGPSELLEVRALHPDRSHTVVLPGPRAFDGPWRWAFERPAGKPVTAVVVVWRAAAGTALSLHGPEEASTAPEPDDPRQAPALKWVDVRTVYGRPTADGGAAEWSIPPAQAAATHLRFTPGKDLQIQRIELTLARGGTRQVPDAAKQLAAGVGAVVALPAGLKVTRVRLVYKSATRWPSIGLALALRAR